MPPPTVSMPTVSQTPAAASWGTRLPAGSWAARLRRRPAAKTARHAAVITVTIWAPHAYYARPAIAAANASLSPWWAYPGRVRPDVKNRPTAPIAAPTGPAMAHPRRACVERVDSRVSYTGCLLRSWSRGTTLPSGRPGPPGDG